MHFQVIVGKKITPCLRQPFGHPFLLSTVFVVPFDQRQALAFRALRLDVFVPETLVCCVVVAWLYRPKVRSGPLVSRLSPGFVVQNGMLSSSRMLVVVRLCLDGARECALQNAIATANTGRWGTLSA